MSESDTPEGAVQPGAGQPAAGQPGAPIRILGQYIKDLSFEVPNAPDIFNLLRQKPPEIPVSMDTAVQHINAGSFEVTLSLNLEATVGDKAAFILELIYGCVVELDQKTVPENQVHPFLHIEVPRQLFPFVRQIVGEMTVGGGFPPLMLQMVDFNDMYRRKFANAAAQGSGGEQSAAAPAPDSPPPQRS
jgi:preprotein translocase subunit SecB